MFKYLHHLCESNPSAVNGVTLTLVVFVIPLLSLPFQMSKGYYWVQRMTAMSGKNTSLTRCPIYAFLFFFKNILSSVVSSRLLIQAEQTKLQCVTKLHIVQATVVQYVPNCWIDILYFSTNLSQFWFIQPNVRCFYCFINRYLHR